jgi:hypothetical protein
VGHGSPGELGRLTRRSVTVALLVTGIAACGGGGAGGGGSSARPTPTPAAAAACLGAAGYRVVDGSPNPQTGASAQLLTSGAYIAFYQSSAVAARAEPAIAKAAKALKGFAVREGSATVDFVGSPLTAAARQKIVSCVG